MDSYQSWEFGFPVLVEKNPLIELNRHRRYDRHRERSVKRWQTHNQCVEWSQSQGHANGQPETMETADKTPASKLMKLRIFLDR
jgi:hypothetical protein